MGQDLRREGKGREGKGRGDWSPFYGRFLTLVAAASSTRPMRHSVRLRQTWHTLIGARGSETRVLVYTTHLRGCQGEVHPAYSGWEQAYG
jgi:hypothetical protein